VAIHSKHQQVFVRSLRQSLNIVFKSDKRILLALDIEFINVRRFTARLRVIH